LEKYDDLIGMMMDKDLAERIGCVPSAVEYRKKKFGISRYKPQIHLPVNSRTWEWE
jgi:hypothetical protein